MSWRWRCAWSNTSYPCGWHTFSQRLGFIATFMLEKCWTHEIQLTFDPGPCMIDDDDSITGHLCYHPRLNPYALGSDSFTRRGRVTRPHITPQCCHQPWLRPRSRTIYIYLDIITVVHTYTIGDTKDGRCTTLNYPPLWILNCQSRPLVSVCLIFISSFPEALTK